MVAAPGVASAQRINMEEAPPIRADIPWRKGRHQIAPMVGFSFGDVYVRNLSAGLNYRYYFTNWFGAGVDFYAHYLNLDTSLTGQITDELTQPGQSGAPSTSGLGIMATAAITLVPIYGKFMLFGKVPLAYDVHIIAGAGYATTSGTGRIESGGGFTPMFGFGARIFFSSWIALEVEVRDYMLNMQLVAPSSVVNPAETFEHNWMVTTGVSFFFPPEPERDL